jgi:precorrin-3B methylase
MGVTSDTEISIELAILRFWAAAMHIEQSFSQAEIEVLPGLAAAIAAARQLPGVIGWDDAVLAAPEAVSQTPLYPDPP